VGPANAKLAWTVVKEHVAPDDNEMLNKRKVTNEEPGYKDIAALKMENKTQDPTVTSLMEHQTQYFL